MSHPGIVPFILMGLRGSSLVVKFSLSIFIAVYMDFAVLGSYGLVVSASIIIPVLAGFALMYTISRDAVMQSLSEITESLACYGVIILLIYSVLLVFAAVVGISFNIFALSILVFVVIFLEHLNNDLYTLLLNLSKPLLANLLHFLRSAAWMLSFMSLAFFLPDFRTLEHILIGWIIGGIISFSAFLWFSRSWPWHTKRNITELKSWAFREFYKSRLVYAHSLAGTFAQNIDRFIISYFLGLDLTGVYVFFWSVISALINLLRTGIVQVARPKMIRAYKDGTKIFYGLYIQCMKQTIAFALGMALIAGPSMYVLIELMHKPLAESWFNAFWLIIITFILVMIIEVNRLVFYSAHRDDLILRQSLIILPISIISHSIFVILFDFWGAAFSPVLICGLTIAIQRRQMKVIFES